MTMFPERDTVDQKSVPSGAAFSTNGDSPTATHSVDQTQTPEFLAAQTSTTLAMAAMIISMAALTLAVYVFVTREVPSK